MSNVEYSYELLVKLELRNFQTTIFLPWIFSVKATGNGVPPNDVINR